MQQAMFLMDTNGCSSSSFFPTLPFFGIRRTEDGIKEICKSFRWLLVGGGIENPRWWHCCCTTSSTTARQLRDFITESYKLQVFVVRPPACGRDVELLLTIV